MTPSLRDRRREFSRGLIVALIAGAFLALTGAFGSGAAPFALRLAYWVLLMVLGGLCGHLCAAGVRRFIDFDERPWLGVLILTLAITGPLSVVVWITTGLFFDGLSSIQSLPRLVIPVMVVTAAASAVNILLGRAQPRQTHAGPSSPVRAAFLNRLPPRLRGAVIRAVQAEDHYLRIHTDRGSDLVLMRLSDAVEELEGLEGARTHRSWWVARDSVRGVERRDGRATLTLDGGLVAPVSRRYARALREAGWW